MLKGKIARLRIGSGVAIRFVGDVTGLFIGANLQHAFATVNDKDVALLRKNLQAEAKQLITKNMQFTDSEAAAFWPLYDQYSPKSAR